jgi:hypothetical protein
VVVPVLIELAALSQVVRQRLPFHHHAEMLAAVALSLQQGLASAVKWQWGEEDPGKLAPQQE